MANDQRDKLSPVSVIYVSLKSGGKRRVNYVAQTLGISAGSGLAIVDSAGQAIFLGHDDWKSVEIRRPEVMTMVSDFRRTNGELELVTEDAATVVLATEARLNGRPTDFAYWDGRRTRKVRGVVTSLSTDKGPVSFTVLPKA